MTFNELIICTIRFIIIFIVKHEMSDSEINCYMYMITLKTEVHSCVGAGKDTTYGKIKAGCQVFIKAPVVG